MKNALAALLMLGLLAACGSETPEQETTDLVNPNTATAEELAALPHVSEGLASGLVEARPFESMAALHAALSAALSAEQTEELYTRMFIPIHLNTASREEMLLIPGVGERMAGEFEEYRPYQAMEEFRREIGKYVDDDELARLERYVTLD